MAKRSRTLRLLGLLLFFLFTLALTLPASSTAASPQQPSSATSVPVVLRWVPHAGPRIRVPQLYAPAMQPAGASFSVNYLAAGTTDGQGATCLTWSPQAQTTFAAALNAWATLINSSVPIRIDACWADLGATSTLGYSWSSLKGNFGAGQADTWYSSALADSLAGHDVDTTKADTHITYNKQFNWYYGTDGNPPLDKMDFMSVVMHEVGHSLNFTGSMNVDANGLGYWGYTSRVYPNIYDRFIQNSSGQSLLDTNLFPNGSYPLADQLTGNDLWFTGANAKAANGAENVKIYAPYWWDPGSSYAHLDYDTFAGTANQMMVYAIDQGDAIHSPGPVGLGVLKDVGWNPPVPPPGAFSKAAPLNGATGQSTSPTLTWGSSSGATSYEYCVNTSNNCSAPAIWTNVGNTTSNTLSGLSANTTYYWQVRAKTTSTTEADGGTWWSFTTQGGGPGAFSKTAPTNGASGQSTSPTLSWGSSSGATSYEYCFDTTNNTACDAPAAWTTVGTNTSASVSGLSGGTTYYWQVRARNASGTVEANGGTWWSLTTQGGGTVPGAFAKTAPANGATGQPTSLTLSWDSSSGAASYDYCYDTSNNSSCDTPWAKVDTNTSVGLSGLSPNTTYYWQVRARNATGTTESNSGTWWSFTTQAGAPGAFAKTAPANGATGQSTSPTLSWGSSSGATSYEYCVNTSNNCNAPASWTNVGNSTSANVSGLSANTTYYWQVRASTTEADGGTWWSFTTQAGGRILEETDSSVQYNGWFGMTSPGSLNGMTHISRIKNDKVTFKFVGTRVTWYTLFGSAMGKARFTIDGRPYDNKTGIVDLCGTTALLQAGPLKMSGLSAGSHTVVIKVLGTKNPLCTDTYVPVDGFEVDSAVTEDDDPRVQYNSWAGVYDDNASGRSYRSSKTKNSIVSLTFTGTSIDWITALGPGYGKALVLIDNGATLKEIVDLYSPVQQWQIAKSYSNLGPGTHTIQIVVPALKNAKSKGKAVVVDGFSGPIAATETAAQVEPQLEEYDSEEVQ